MKPPGDAVSERITVSLTFGFGQRFLLSPFADRVDGFGALGLTSGPNGGVFERFSQCVNLTASRLDRMPKLFTSRSDFVIPLCCGPHFEAKRLDLGWRVSMPSPLQLGSGFPKADL